MVKITNEVNGKKYDLAPETDGCKGCDLRKKCDEISPQAVHSVFNGCCVCAKLHGIWKEAGDDKNNK